MKNLFTLYGLIMLATPVLYSRQISNAQRSHQPECAFNFKNDSADGDIIAITGTDMLLVAENKATVKVPYSIPQPKTCMLTGIKTPQGQPLPVPDLQVFRKAKIYDNNYFREYQVYLNKCSNEQTILYSQLGQLENSTNQNSAIQIVDI